MYLWVCKLNGFAAAAAHAYTYTRFCKNKIFNFTNINHPTKPQHVHWTWMMMVGVSLPKEGVFETKTNKLHVSLHLHAKIRFSNTDLNTFFFKKKSTVLRASSAAFGRNKTDICDRLKH